MGRLAYTISNKADSQAALRWLRNKGMGLDLPNNPAPNTVQQWCLHNLDKAQWIQLKYAVRMARTREARKQDKPIVRVDMTQKAHSILAGLSKQYGVSLSQVIIDKWGNVANKKVKSNKKPKQNSPNVSDKKQKRDGVLNILPLGTSIINDDANINGIKYNADYSDEADGQCQAITHNGQRCKQAKGTCNVHVYNGGLYLACRKYHDNANFKPYLEGDSTLLSYDSFMKMVVSMPNADKLHKAMVRGGYIHFKDEKGNKHKATQRLVRSMAKQVRAKLID